MVRCELGSIHLSNTAWESRWLYLASGGLTLASIAIAFGTWFSFANLKDVDVTSSMGREAVAKPPMTTIDGSPVSFDDALWSRPLQYGFRDKVDLSPEPVAMPSPSPPVVPLARTLVKDLGLRLVGTAIEAGQSIAIVVDQQGKLDFRKEGEELSLQPSGVRIESVLAKSVRISYLGQTREWGLGQPLTWETQTTIHEPNTPSSVNPSKPKMSIEDELERMNRAEGSP
jgi:hypothetical protein